MLTLTLTLLLTLYSQPSYEALQPAETQTEVEEISYEDPEDCACFLVNGKKVCNSACGLLQP